MQIMEPTESPVQWAWRIRNDTTLTAATLGAITANAEMRKSLGRDSVYTQPCIQEFTEQ